MVRVRFKKGSKSAKIVYALDRNRSLTVKELAEMHGVSRQCVWQVLRRAQMTPSPGRPEKKPKVWPKPEPRFGSELPSGIVGAISEQLVAADLFKKGFDVYKSLAANARCDLIVVCRATEKIYRVEVKSASRTPNGSLRCGRTDRNAYDILACLVGDSEITYTPDISERP